ncbi:hypothetical protein FAIPA1_300032 [Frankia sp. AiPs1]|nr:hypothetical protein [Frankia sp. AiPa1]
MAPNRDPRRPWLQLRADETAPRVLTATRPVLVVWSTLWPAHPDDRIRFDLTPTGQETTLAWALLSPVERDAEEVAPRRRRINELINARLRYTFGQ